MRRLIIFLVVLGAAIWLGIKIAADPGYVLITRQHWTVEAPLWAAVLVGLVFFIVLYFLIRILRHVRVIPQRWRTWFSQRNARLGYELTSQGLLQWSLGDLRQAHNKLLRAVRYSGGPVWLNYIVLAMIANEQKNFSRRDQYLVRAQQQTPEAEAAVGMAQANFYLQQQRSEQALVILQRIHQLAPQQKHIVRSLVCLYSSLKEWGEIQKLLPEIRKAKIYSTEALFSLESKVYKELLVSGAVQWSEVPRYLHHQPEVVLAHADVLMKKQQGHLLEDLVRRALNKNWDEKLVRCYGLLKSHKVHQQLDTAEEWLPNHKNDAMLLLTLGRLSLYNELWGKARSYFQASIALTPYSETYLELAKLSEKLNDEKMALQYYRKGLELG